MRILIVDENIDKVGGVERVIATLANKLIQEHKVMVLSEYKTSETPFYNYDTNIERKYLIDAINDKTNKSKKKNIKYYVFRIIEKIRDRIIKRKRIEKFVSNLNDIDVIIFGRVYSALDFLDILKKYNIKTKIFVRDAIHIEFFSKTTKKKMLKYFPDMVNKFIVSSEESVQAYKRFFGSNTPEILKIYNPLGIIPKQGFNFDKKTVISIGRMDKQKGFENLINAFERIHNKHSNWQLKLYGDGNYKKNLEEEINRIRANDYIKILPSTNNVVEIFNNSSIFVLPSRYEGYANILVEAMACGIPCVSYNWLMGVEEIITHNVNGMIVNLQDRKKYFLGVKEKKDIIELSKQIEYLIEHEELCKKIGNEANKIVQTRNIDTILEQWKKIIKDN